jgi:PEP-CTERM motif
LPNRSDLVFSSKACANLFAGSVHSFKLFPSHFGDFQLLAQYFGATSTTWDEGDFTYSGATTFGDFQLLAQDFGANLSGLASSEIASLNNFAESVGDQLVANPGRVGFQLISVPEPASAGVLAVAALGILGRRRRKRN